MKNILNFFLLFHPVRLLKNIINNWCIKQTQRLRYMNPQTSIAAWKDLVSIWKKESECVVRQNVNIVCSPLSKRTLKSKKRLYRSFKEKTIATLNMQGSVETA